VSAWLTRHHTLARWLPALTWMAVIFLLSSQSGLRVTEDAAVDRPIRTVAHLSSYALLAGLVLFALGGLGRPSLRNVVLAMAVTALYAVSDELHQALVPDRTGRAADVFVDVIGAAAGLLVAAVVLASRDRTSRSAGPLRGSDPASPGANGLDKTGLDASGLDPERKQA
jgi:VanZ family protein